jgi:hypothetical protein
MCMTAKVDKTKCNNFLSYVRVNPDDHPRYRDILLCLSNTKLPYKGVFNGYLNDLEWGRIYIELQRDEDDMVTSFKRITRPYKNSKIEVIWGKLEYNKNNLITYSDSDGHCWKKEWGVPLIEYRILQIIEQGEFTLDMLHTTFKDICLGITPAATTFLVH